MLVECSECGAVVNAEEIAIHEYDFPPELEFFKKRVTFLNCPKCKSPLLASQDESDSDGWGEPLRIYPPSDRDLHHSVPKPIQEAFSEAHVCFRAKAFTAAAIMCRKTLEGICSENGVRSSGTLAAQLKKLKDDGIIENRLFEWAEELRTIGNEAAHGVEFVVSKADARDTLEFTEALIEYVFTYRHKFDQFKKRRAKKVLPSKGE
jgi:hypothetical protein